MVQFFIREKNVLVLFTYFTQAPFSEKWNAAVNKAVASFSLDTQEKFPSAALREANVLTVEGETNFDASDYAVSDSKTIESGVINNSALSLPAPVYPPAARAVRAEETVTVLATVDENGDVVETNAASDHSLLRAAAEKAARNAKFKSFVVSGQAVRVKGIITYNFIL